MPADRQRNKYTDTQAHHNTQLPSQGRVIIGDAENARHEIAGHENAAPDCKGGKCET